MKTDLQKSLSAKRQRCPIKKFKRVSKKFRSQQLKEKWWQQSDVNEESTTSPQCDRSLSMTKRLPIPCILPRHWLQRRNSVGVNGDGFSDGNLFNDLL